jgi:RNA polymerase sigma-70 factor (ECF subfamily)
MKTRTASQAESIPSEWNALDRPGQQLEKLRPKMTALALRFTRARDTAEDVVQNAFEKALRGADQFEGRSRYSTWVHRIVVNESLIWLRKERRRIQRTDRFADETRAAPAELKQAAPRPDRLLAARQRAEQLRQRVARLPRNERHVIESCALDGMSYADYASSIGISTATAKTRAHRARRHLARQGASNIS